MTIRRLRIFTHIFGAGHELTVTVKVRDSRTIALDKRANRLSDGGLYITSLYSFYRINFDRRCNWGLLESGCIPGDRFLF